MGISCCQWKTFHAFGIYIIWRADLVYCGEQVREFWALWRKQHELLHLHMC
jgi:hypothetical protein